MTAPPLPALLLPLGNDHYAVPARLVREVVAGPRPTRLPTAPQSIVGMINLRGEVVPLFDTTALLGLGPGRTAAFAAVVQTARGRAALAVDGLPHIAELVDHVGPSELHGTDGRYAVDGHIAVLLDVERLIR